MKRVYILLIIVALAISGFGQTLSLDAYLGQLQKGHFMPGFSVVVVRDQEVVYERGFGLEYIDSKKPMTASSSMAVGSLAKSFTALAIMQLVEEGKLSLDESVVSYLPWFRTANKEISDQITVRMLLNNTSGLKAPVVRNRDNSDQAARNLAASINSVHLSRQPGSSFAYSNDGFALAGLLIEELSGISYTEYMEQRIFAPLDMPLSTHDPSRFATIETLYGHYPGIGEAIPVLREDDYLQEYAAAGSLMRSSASEMGHYLVALLNDGKYLDRQVLSLESIRQMWEPYASFPGIRVEDGGEGLPFSYGLGWIRGELDGKDYVFHGGNRRNMSSMTFICPEKGVAAALFANIDLTFVDRYHYPNLVHVLNNIIRITLGEATSEFALPVVGDPTENLFILPGEEKESYLGHYRLSEGNDWVYLDSRLRVFEQENGLAAEISRGGQVLERFQIDFMTRKTAVSRNLSMPQEIQFSFLQSGEVSSLYISGRKYSRITEAYLSAYKEVASPGTRIHFHLPNSFHIQWEGTSFQGSDQMETMLQGMLHDEVSSLNSVFSGLFPDHQVLQSGLEFTELVGSRHWKSMAKVTVHMDQEFYHHLILTQQDSQAYVIVLSTLGNLSQAVNTLIPTIQENFVWTKYP